MKIISTEAIPKIEVMFDYYHNDEMRRVVIQEDQIVTVTYTDSSKRIRTIPHGRINRFIYIKTDSSTFSDRYIIRGIELDCSQECDGRFIRIHVGNIIEIKDFESDEDFKQANLLKVKANLVAKVRITLSDGTVNEREIRDGDIVSDLVYAKDPTKPSVIDKITGTVQSIKYKNIDTSQDGEILDNLNASVNITDCVEIEGLSIRVIDNNIGTRTIPPDLILDFGKRMHVVNNLDEIQTVINSMNEKEILRLPSGVINRALRINKTIYICGANSGVSAFDGIEKSPATKFIKPLSFSLGVNAYFDGCRFTSSSGLRLINSGHVVILDCVFSEMSQRGNNIMIANNINTECTALISDCYFDTNISDDMENSSISHNIFATGPLKKTFFYHNYFKKGCCKSDNISIHGIAEYSFISIESNTFEYAGSGINIGTQGIQTGCVYINDNVYHETKSGPDAGLIRIEPYIPYTVSFECIKITCCGNKKPTADTPLWYLCNDKVNCKITQSKRPTIFENEKIVMKPLPDTVMSVVK